MPSRLASTSALAFHDINPELSAEDTAATMLPDEILEQLNSEFPCRELQIRHLAALYSVRR